MKKIIIFLPLLLIHWVSVTACPLCNREIRNEIYNSQFYPNLFTMLSAFLVLAVIVAVLSAISVSRHRRRLAAHPGIVLPSPVPLTTASIILGIGLGGFVDGIVLHQILQTHEMLSNKIPATDYIGKSVNMFWDGIFHAFCLMVTLAGIILLWKAARYKVDLSAKVLFGGLLFGWGIFNLVEGIVDHQILKLHNVIEYAADHNPGNYIFLAVSVIMTVIGYWLIKSAKYVFHQFDTE